MLKLFAVLSPLLIVALLAQTPSSTPPAPAPAQAEPAAQATPPADAAPPAEAAPADEAPAAAAAAPVPAENPVKATAESQARAKEMFKMDCAMCHGENGNGKGDLVESMELKMKDLRDPDTLKDKTDGELYTIIRDGKGKMTAEGDRAKPDAMWNLVIYVRSMAKK
jgi:mono/diheme cytochrome c family protein